MRTLSIMLLAIILLPALGRADAREMPSDSWSVPQLIDALGDADAAVRKAASLRLTRMGLAARPALLEAARSDDPEQRAQAAAILKKLPWWNADDPPDIRALLERYGDAGDMGRVALVRRLNDVGGTGAMLRLLTEEPSDTVRWMIVVQLWDERDARTQRMLRDMRVEESDPPVLVLAGKSWLARDRRKGLDLLRRAIDADEARPSNDVGLLGFAFDKLTEEAIGQGDFDSAASLLRREVPRELTPRRMMRTEASSSLANLLALHEYFGPLEKYQWDLRTWGAAPTKSPSAVDAVMGLFMMLGHAPPLPMGITAAMGAEERYGAGVYLARRELMTAAELELRGALAMPKPQQDLHDANILFLLAQLKSESDDDLAVADLLDRAMQIKGRNQFEMNQRSDDDVFAELNWRRARAAEKARDHASADKFVSAMMQYTPTNTDAAINIVNWLKQTHRASQAKIMFEKIYTQSHAKLEAAQEKSGPQNDLAWLCARAGERLDDALKMAQSAASDQPENAAFLDTLAECQYRLGHRDDAIASETKAVAFNPESKFMREQLERFRAGKP